jgi:hypothetical protein
MYDKEQIYDEKIFPLMKEVIEICKENDIQMLFSCYLKTDENGNMNCTTYLPSKEQNCDNLQDAIKVIKHGYVVQKPYFTAMTITSK